jgi:hypothetical protein
MKRKFAVLTVLGALIAFAAPASSMGSMFPAGHKFEIVGGATGPKLTTSLGSCLISKINGQIPAAPANEEAGPLPVTVTPGTCTSGTSLTLSGEWQFVAAAFMTVLHGTTGESVVLRFSSLPGCKLVGNGVLVGTWSNGVTTPSLLKSGYHAHNANNLTWKNDGGTCALAGKTESLAWEDQTAPPPVYGVVLNTVNNLTSANVPIVVGPIK